MEGFRRVFGHEDSVSWRRATWKGWELVILLQRFSGEFHFLSLIGQFAIETRCQSFSFLAEAKDFEPTGSG